MDPSSNRVVDAEARIRVGGLLDRRRRERICEVAIAGSVEDPRVAVEIGPRSTARAKCRELEVRRVDTSALEDGVLGISVRTRYIISAAFGQPNVFRLLQYDRPPGRPGHYLRSLARGELNLVSVVPYEGQRVVQHGTAPSPSGPS